MKATDFVKKFGIDLVKRDIAAWQSGFIKREDFLEHYGFDILDDLKQIVDAWELVEWHGGLAEAKWDLDNPKIDASEAHDLKKAINLVEQCQND